MLWKLSVVLAAAAAYVYYTRDTFNPDYLRNKNVLVTGSSRGIGKALAIEYAKLGANVMLTARGENELKKVLQECKRVGRKDAKFGYVIADMIKYDEVADTVVQKTLEALGGLDQVILNHALLSGMGAAWSGTTDDLSNIVDMMAINFHSYVYLASAVMPHLAKSHGQLGVISSLAGKIESYGAAPYCASKFALDGFFSTLRLEGQIEKQPVSITVHNLGLIGTENIGDHIQMFIDKNNLDKDKVMAMTPPPADVHATALEVIKATTRGDRELYYPAIYGLNTRLVPIIRHTIPSVLYTDINALKKS